MSDKENRSKSNLSNSLFRYERPFNLLGGVIMGLALLVRPLRLTPRISR